MNSIAVKLVLVETSIYRQVMTYLALNNHSTNDLYWCASKEREKTLNLAVNNYSPNNLYLCGSKEREKPLN